MLKRRSTWRELDAAFAWQIPERYNIGVDVCERWARSEPDRLAVIDIDADGVARDYSFGELDARANRLANALLSRSVSTQVDDDGQRLGDRVAVLLPQCLETAVAHIAILKMGCISVPLFTLFGEQALLHRLRDAGVKAVITHRAGCKQLQALRQQLPDLQCVLSIDGEQADAEDYRAACANASERFDSIDTLAEDPALLIYTSGTTGSPKGALHAHRVLPGHLPGVEISHDFLPQPDDRLWTPADWAWIGGLLDVLMPALHHGVAVVGRRFDKFDATAAFELLQAHRVRNVFLPPTAMKLMRQQTPPERWAGLLRSVASGGETLGAELIDWSHQVLGAPVNEFYGQTECNMVVSSCAALETAVPGVMGRAVPGHVVAIIDAATGERVDAEGEGEIAVRAPDPVMFLRYWRNPEATAAKFVQGSEGRWLLTGDRGILRTDGRIRFLGRDDDVISSAGYRIGPAEVEDCLIRHPAVALAGVVGMPDAVRGTVVTAYVQLVPGSEPEQTLADDIAGFVKQQLAAHEYPRVVRFVTEMPMTTTGKIIRRELRARAVEEFERASTRGQS